MKEAKIQEAMAKKGKFKSLTIGQLKALEGKYPDIPDGEEGHMIRVYDRLAWTYSTILTNSGVKTSEEEVNDLPSNHALGKMLLEFLTGGVPVGNGGDSTSTATAGNAGDGSPPK